MTRVTKGVVYATYWMLVLPLGAAQRLLRRPGLDFRFRDGSHSYWRRREKTAPAKQRYETQL